MSRQLMPKPLPAREPGRNAIPIRPVDTEFLDQSVKVAIQEGNHASIFLIIVRGYFSVRLNMCLGADLKGVPESKTCYYDPPRSELASITLPVRSLWRARDYLSIIKRKGRHLYRLWVDTVVNDLENEDGPLPFLDHTSSRRALGFLRVSLLPGM